MPACKHHGLGKHHDQLQPETRLAAALIFAFRVLAIASGIIFNGYVSIVAGSAYTLVKKTRAGGVGRASQTHLTRTASIIGRRQVAAQWVDAIREMRSINV